MSESEFMVAIYFFILGTVISVEHFTVGRWLKHNELARRGIGIVTVLGLAAPFVFFADLMDITTFLIICGGFLVAAGCKLFFVAIEHEQQRQKRIELDRTFIDDEVGV